MTMNRYIQAYGLKPGDTIMVPKSWLNLVPHYAVYLGYDQLGTHWIIENIIGAGVRLITVDDFFAANPAVHKITRFTGANTERKTLVEKALASVGRPYNLIVYNCEHFAEELHTGVPRSRQVEKTLIGAFALLIIGLAFKD